MGDRYRREGNRAEAEALAGAGFANNQANLTF